MERSRSKRSYYYDHQDYDTETVGRTRPRYNHHYSNTRDRHNNNNNRRAAAVKQQQGQQGQESASVTTSYRILCHDMKAGGVIGKSGSIIKSIRQHTGAWINVHELVAGDEERIIEISDQRRRDPEGRMPAFSPAQEALFLIHERILDSEVAGAEEDDEYGGGGGGGGGRGTRVATRLVVSRMHVGSLLGKGGKIIEQMRMETKTQIRVLPRDHNLPRCVSMSEEIVQVVGDPNNVKAAVEVISSRLRESQHRDRGNNFHGRAHSPERFFPPDDDYIPHMNNAGRKSSMDGSGYGSRLSGPNARNSNYGSRSSGYMIESGSAPMDDNVQPFYGEDLVFRMLCPVDKVDLVLGESDGIIDLLQNEIGVDVRATEPVAGADEQMIIISSEEGPDDELFPAQEALLHIQTRIVDLIPDGDNIITTRLLVSSSDIGCLEGRDGSLSDMMRHTGANIQILPREELPPCVSGNDMLLQIVGEIKVARDALVEVTSRLRSHVYRELFQKDNMTLSAPAPASSALDYINPIRQARTGNGPSIATYQNVQTAQPSKDSGVVVNEATKLNESEKREDVPTGLNRIPVTLVTRSILEVVIPEKAVSKLITKSKNMLAQISELSGARVTLVEDSPELTQKIIQISGTPEQTERAQSLLQGFILSTQEDDP
ncbi:RNA-binding KH domain-containing protein RCF3 isoform X2 [Argentina anserina]|uniref:RNA-binding KH domain-containing protein RCF3 isoform X2 n=1 Tax=Argentina anserina TaxID=57926 RepID=UPI0021766F6D|nr:RNA-binding KH domain-containing protein RCF3 isoform X2 [Potentilla anserina]